MDRYEKVKVSPLNPGEAKVLKALVFDLGENGAKQCLYGIIQVLSLKNNLSRAFFEEILDDSIKYNKLKNGR